MKLVEWDELRDWSHTDTRTLVSRLGLEVARQINADKLQFRQIKPPTEVDPGEFVLEEPIKPLFDSHARVIVPQGFKPKFVDANRGFHLVQPHLGYFGFSQEPGAESARFGYAERLERFEAAFQRKLGVTAAEFESKIAKIMARLATDPLTSNLILNGVALPTIVPQTEITPQHDYGTVLEEIYVAALERAYMAEYPDRTFTNHRKGTLAGQVKVVAKSHQALIDAIYTGPAVGLYFPNALQGLSIPADREIMNHLPSDFLLCGAIDTMAAASGYPDVLARDYQTPGLDCAAVQWRDASDSLYFRASGGVARFDCRGLLAHGSYSGGLFLLG